MTETKTRQMKPSGVPWLGDIPAGWDVIRNKNCFACSKEIVGTDSSDTQLLSLTTAGIKTKGRDVLGGKLPESFDTYQIVRKNNLVMCLFDMDCSAVFSGVSPFDGMISPAYKVLTCKAGVDSQFTDYWFRFIGSDRVFMHYAKNIRHSLTYEDFADLPFLLPPLPEQRAIADFLDEKCAAIDAIVEEAKAGIEEYAKWKQSVVFQAVTKGLDPHAKMKDSGVDIIGEMPMKWDLRRLRFICSVSTGNQDTQNSVPDGQYPFFVRSPIVERSNAFTFDGMAVLMAGDGAGAGKVFHIYSGKMAIHQRVYCFHEFKDVRPKFFFYFMQNRFGVEIDKGSAKSTVPSVRLPMLLDFRVCLPTINEQDRIVEHLDEKCSAIDALIEEKKQLIEDLGVYKKSLIYETVTGKRSVAK